MTRLGRAPPDGAAASAGWPIRRKLVALVAGPLLVILVRGALVTTQAVGQLREAQDAQKVATAALYSNRLSQALQRELHQTRWRVINDEPTRRATAHRRSRRDWPPRTRPSTQLLGALADAPRGGWDVATQSKLRGRGRGPPAPELAAAAAPDLPEGHRREQRIQARSRRPSAARTGRVVQVGYRTSSSSPGR